MPQLRASVQYGDWEGTAAADNGDTQNITELLRERGHIDENEFVAAIEFSIWENHSKTVIDNVSITAFIAKTPEGENWGAGFARDRSTLKLRQVEIKMTIPEFFGHFKRFAIMLTASNLNLTDRTYEVG
jgi:hypothetical protein